MLSSYVSPQSQNFHVLNDERKAKVQWTEDLFPGDRYRVVGKTQEDGKIFFTMKANTSHHVFFVDVKTGEVSTKVRSQRRGFSYTATKAVLMPQCSVAAPTM